jgi:hypothetical protein
MATKLKIVPFPYHLHTSMQSGCYKKEGESTESSVTIRGDLEEKEKPAS